MIQKQQGNVLFLILIAVALFAALSYAVTKSTSGGGNADKEKARLLASEILSYYNSVNVAVLRMHISGVSLVDMCFDDPLWATTGDVGDYRDNPSCSDNTKRVFHSEGGGASAQVAPDISYWPINRISGSVSVHSIGTTEADLIMGFLMDDNAFSKVICDSLNEAAGIDPNTADLSGGTIRMQDWDSFEGSYATLPRPVVQQIGEEIGSAFAGKTSGCAHGSSHHGNRYVYYQVLQAR